MKSLNVLLSLVIVSHSWSALAYICPADEQHPILTKVHDQVEEQCKKDYQEIKNLFSAQDESEASRLIKGQEHLKALKKRSVSVAATALTLGSYGYSRMMTSQYKGKILDYLGSLSEGGRKGIEKELADMAIKDEKHFKAFAEYQKALKNPKTPKATLDNLKKSMNDAFQDLYSSNPPLTPEKYEGLRTALSQAKTSRERIAIMKELGKENVPRKAYFAHNLYDELLELQKIEIDDVVPVRNELSEATLKSFSDEFAVSAAKSKELNQIVKMGQKLSHKKYMAKVATTLGITSLAADLTIMALSSSRVAPELLWAEAVEKNPDLLFTPEVMEENGILQSKEKGSSAFVACLALQRHKPLMMKAVRKLIDRQEQSFQNEVMMKLYPKEILASIEVKPIPSESTSVRKPSHLPVNSESPKNKVEIPDWLKK